MTIEINGDGIIKFNGVNALKLGPGPFLLNEPVVEEDYTIPENSNAMSAGPITIGENVTVTVSQGSEWTVV